MKKNIITPAMRAEQEAAEAAEQEYNAMKNTTARVNAAMMKLEAEERAAAIQAAAAQEAAAARAREAFFTTKAAVKEAGKTPIIPAEITADSLNAAARAVITIKATVAERRRIVDKNGREVMGIDPAHNPWRLYREDLQQEAAAIIMEVMKNEAAEAEKYGSAERAVFAHIGRYEYRTYERHAAREKPLEHAGDTDVTSYQERMIVDRLTAEAVQKDLEEYAAAMDGQSINGTYAADIIFHRPTAARKQEKYRARQSIIKAAAAYITTDRAMDGHGETGYMTVEHGEKTGKLMVY